MKKEKVRGLKFSYFKIYYKVIVIKIVWYGCKDQNIGQWNRIESGNKLMNLLIFDKDAKSTTFFSMNDAETNSEPHAKEWRWILTSYYLQKLTSNG